MEEPDGTDNGANGLADDGVASLGFPKPIDGFTAESPDGAGMVLAGGPLVWANGVDENALVPPGCPGPLAVAKGPVPVGGSLPCSDVADVADF